MCHAAPEAPPGSNIKAPKAPLVHILGNLNIRKLNVLLMIGNGVSVLVTIAINLIKYIHTKEKELVRKSKVREL